MRKSLQLLNFVKQRAYFLNLDENSLILVLNVPGFKPNFSDNSSIQL